LLERQTLNRAWLPLFVSLSKHRPWSFRNSMLLFFGYRLEGMKPNVICIDLSASYRALKIQPLSAVHSPYKQQNLFKI
jgi:hypothetical protein